MPGNDPYDLIFNTDVKSDPALRALDKKFPIGAARTKDKATTEAVLKACRNLKTDDPKELKKLAQMVKQLSARLNDNAALADKADRAMASMGLGPFEARYLLDARRIDRRKLDKKSDKDKAKEISGILKTQIKTMGSAIKAWHGLEQDALKDFGSLQTLTMTVRMVQTALVKAVRTGGPSAVKDKTIKQITKDILAALKALEKCSGSYSGLYAGVGTHLKRLRQYVVLSTKELAKIKAQEIGDFFKKLAA
jgi:hypothetical protein